MPIIEVDGRRQLRCANGCNDEGASTMRRLPWEFLSALIPLRLFVCSTCKKIELYLDDAR